MQSLAKTMFAGAAVQPKAVASTRRQQRAPIMAQAAATSTKLNTQKSEQVRSPSGYGGFSGCFYSCNTSRDPSCSRQAQGAPASRQGGTPVRAEAARQRGATGSCGPRQCHAM